MFSITLALALAAALSSTASPVPQFIQTPYGELHCPVIPQSEPQGTNENANPDPKSYTYLVIRQKAPAFSGANATQALFDIEDTIPKGDPYAPLPPTGFYGESRGFSFVVKQRGDNNLIVHNAAEALRQTRANLRQTIPENNTVVSDKVMVMDGNYNEAITGFYPTDWLELMQGCPH